MEEIVKLLLCGKMMNELYYGGVKFVPEKKKRIGKLLWLVVLLLSGVSIGVWLDFIINLVYVN